MTFIVFLRIKCMFCFTLAWLNCRAHLWRWFCRVLALAWYAIQNTMMHHPARNSIQAIKQFAINSSIQVEGGKHFWKPYSLKIQYAFLFNLKAEKVQRKFCYRMKEGLVVHRSQEKKLFFGIVAWFGMFLSVRVQKRREKDTLHFAGIHLPSVFICTVHDVGRNM